MPELDRQLVCFPMEASVMVDARSVSRRARLIVVVLVALGLASCGDDDEAGSSTTSTTEAGPTSSAAASSTTETTTAEDGSETEISEAYKAAGEAFIAAAAVPDPDDAGVAATHTGPMLEQRREVLSALRADGRVIRYPADSQYRVEVESVEVESDVARLVFCAIDDGERVVASTGEVISSGVATVRGRAAMRLEGGVWKLAEQQFDSREPGVAAC